MSGKFGFQVGHPWRWQNNRYGAVSAEWVVFLPHQCDSWDIVGEDNHEGVPHEEAVSSLRQFIAEAEDALRRLEAREADESE